MRDDGNPRRDGVSCNAARWCRVDHTRFEDGGWWSSSRPVTARMAESPRGRRPGRLQAPSALPRARPQAAHACLARKPLPPRSKEPPVPSVNPSHLLHFCRCARLVLARARARPPLTTTTMMMLMTVMMVMVMMMTMMTMMMVINGDDDNDDSSSASATASPRCSRTSYSSCSSGSSSSTSRPTRRRAKTA